MNITETTIETTASFNSKTPHDTLWLELRFSVAEPPAELIVDLAAIGFVEDGFAKAPALGGVDCVHLGKRGSALFAGWTVDERKANTSAARAVLKKHGFTRVPHNRLSWQDLI